MELVYLKWEDAGAIDETMGWLEINEPAPRTTHVFEQVGFVYDCDPWAIILTEAYNEVHLAPRTRIPLGMIRRFVRLDPDAMPQEEEAP